jgi:hypothetical protein
MTRSLRSRLILGMFVGMTVLLVVAGATIYTVQRRQLYRPLDESLLSSATALTLLVHRGPPGYWFDSLGLERLSAGLTRRGALFQIWSDQPLDILPPRRPEGSAQERPGQLEPPPGDRQPPEEPLPDWEPRYGPPPPPLGEDSEGWPKRVPGEQVIRSPALNEADLPRLDTPTNQRVSSGSPCPTNHAGVRLRSGFNCPCTGQGRAGTPVLPW